jgi:hypothetical protein
VLGNLLRPLRDHSITSSASAIYETRLHWVFTAVKTMGIEVIAAIAARAVTRGDHVDLAMHQLGAQRGRLVELTSRPTVFDDNV